MKNDKKHYMPTIKITEKVREKLRYFKEYYGAKTFNEVINLLIKDKEIKIKKEKH